MLTPQLIFSHLLADYVFQTRWVVERKREGWKGLIIHGGTFFLCAIFILHEYLTIVTFPLLILSIEHIVQDWAKIQISRRLSKYEVFWYFLDQILHLVGILILNAYLRDKIDPVPSNLSLLLFMLGSSVIILTRAWEITAIANWRELREYTHQWLWWGYIERTVMLLVIGLGGALFFPVAILCIVPRLLLSKQAGVPIWKNRLQTFELIGGLVSSTFLGLGIWNLLQYI